MPRKEGIESAAKTLRLMELMAANGGRLTVTQIAQQLDCSIASANRFLQTLQSVGYVEKNSMTNRYELNYRLYALASLQVENDPMVQKLVPMAHAVSQKYDVSVNINAMLGKQAMLLFRVTRHYNKDTDFFNGKTAPAYCTSSGKAILSQYSPAQLDEYFEGLSLRSFQRGSYTEEGLRAELAAAREQGYAVCREEYVSGVFSFSFPIRDREGRFYAFTVICSMREKKAVFQEKIIREIRRQLETLCG